MTTPLFSRALHASWCNLLNACHNAGIARELSYVDLSRRLGPQGLCAAHPERFMELLGAYYRSEGDPSAAPHRRSEDGFASVRFGEPMNAMRWLARLVAAAPTLTGLSVQRAPQLTLRSASAFERLYDDEGWVELADVVDAANALLAMRSQERFVPLIATRWTEAYLRVSWPRAAFLDEAGLLEPDWMISFEGVGKLKAA